MGILRYNFILVEEEKPENGQEVIVLTNSNREIQARYESFLGHEMWETDAEFGEEEKPIAWRKI